MLMFFILDTSSDSKVERRLWALGASGATMTHSHNRIHRDLTRYVIQIILLLFLKWVASIVTRIHIQV